MGQGLHTKIQQLCASCLGIPFDKVYTPTVSTYGNANAPGTGGSTGTDVWGSAVMNACDIINKRLAPYKEKMPTKTFAEICAAASQGGENLSAQGFHIFEPWWTIGGKHGSHDFLYFSWNCGVVEVELDLLTGKFIILNASVWQDVGQSINPIVDIGQIEGGLLQGIGWLTIEDLEATYSPDGVLNLTSDTYAIPSFKSMPTNVNVTLVPNSHNSAVAHSSKGIGEPPYLLGAAVVMAIRHAITTVRKQHEKQPWVPINYPITPARIKEALGDIQLFCIPTKSAKKAKSEE